MKPGVTVEALTEQLASIARTLPERYGGSPAYSRIIEQLRPIVMPLEERIRGAVRAPIWVLFAAAAIVLLIACANVAALMLGQVESRSGELAVRTALGADRVRLTIQLLFESLALGIAGGLLGAACAIAGFDVLPATWMGEHAELRAAQEDDGRT